MNLICLLAHTVFLDPHPPTTMRGTYSATIIGREPLIYIVCQSTQYSRGILWKQQSVV